VERLALLVAPKEPERHQAGEHQQRAQLLQDMQRVAIALAFLDQGGAQRRGQQARVDQQNADANRKETRSEHGVTGLGENSGKRLHGRFS
jgi:hypothetical protein